MQESNRELEGGQSEENDTAPVPVSATSVPVRPETSVENAVVPAVIDLEEQDHKEPDSGLSHHNRVAIRLFKTQTQSIENVTPVTYK